MRKQDHLTKKAKSEGYPARSVYKLQEIDEKYRLFRPGVSVLDLGAAPGSWTRWSRRRVGRNGSIVAVDLSAFEADEQTTVVQADILDPAVAQHLRRYGPFDLVISDAAPATTGNRLVDTGRSEELVEAVFRLASDLLGHGGCVVAKIFAGGGEKAYLDRLRVAFARAALYRPKASRSESMEAFLVGVELKELGRSV